VKQLLIFLCLVPAFLFADPVSPDTLGREKKVTKPYIFKTGGRPRLQFGLQTGTNLNYFIYDKDRKQKDVAAGYQGGVFFRVTRQKAFVQFEMNYLWSEVFLKNGLFTNEIGDSILFDKLTFRYHTFSIPFIFGAYAVKKPLYKLRFYNGIEADFITKTRAIFNNNDENVYKILRKEKRSILRPEQFSYQLGMGMDIAMFIFDVKYNLGFRSFYKEQYRTQTHLFQFTVGAIF
jgi:hypothetical protein